MAKKKLLYPAGVTFVELLLVMAIFIILAASSTPFASRFLIQINHDTTIDKTISSLRKAQANAMDGKDNQTWGVCMSSGDIRFYSGTCGSPSVSEDFNVPGNITVTGLGDTTFNLRGEPSATLSISVTSDLDSDTVSMNSAGGMDVN